MVQPIPVSRPHSSTLNFMKLGRQCFTTANTWCEIPSPFGLFRLASIMQGVYRRVLNGTVASNFAAVNSAPELARQALLILGDKRLATIA